MAACRFLESKKADYNLKYRWLRSFSQVYVRRPKQLSKNIIQTILALLLTFFLKLLSLSHMDSPR